MRKDWPSLHALTLGSESPEEAIPDDEETGVVAIAGRSVVHAVVARRVEQRL